MRQTFDVTYGAVTQQFFFLVRRGRPSATPTIATFWTEDGDEGNTVDLYNSVNVETNPNTTTNSAAAVGATSISLTAITGIVVGGVYQISDSSSNREFVTVTSVSAGSITIRHPLANAYASGSTFQSTRIVLTTNNTIVGDSTYITTKPNPGFRTKITYTLASSTYIEYCFSSLVRAEGRHGVLPLDMENASPGWLDALPTYYREEQGRPLIDEAYRQVKMDLYAEEVADEQIRNGEVVDDLTLNKAIMLAAMTRETYGTGTPEATAAAMKAYEYRLNSLIRLHRAVDQDVTGDGSSSRTVPVPITRR